MGTSRHLALLLIVALAVAGWLPGARPSRASAWPSPHPQPFSSPETTRRGEGGSTLPRPESGEGWGEGFPYAPGVVLVGLRDGLPFPQRQIAAKVIAKVSDLSVCALRVPVGQELVTVERLRRDPGVAFAELDYALRATEVITPNDPGWSQQWALAKIGALQAWGVTTGSPEVLIAVLDSGLQLSHEDLAGKVWTNADEIPGNGVDDDANGKVDDVHGWRFYHRWDGSGFIPAEDADVEDGYGHGTHVAGIAAAASNNGLGIAGVSWGARVMPVKVLDNTGNGWYLDVAAGIIYAADNGARIINLSVGGAPASATLCAAAEYAHRKGCLLVAAAGNTGGQVEYPAACAHVLAVAATDPVDERASFSNLGPEVDLAAPGVDIYSAWVRWGGYTSLSGTSMAAPHVSGVAALIWSRWPALSNDALTTQITRTVTDLGSPGWDEATGWGRLDAGRALSWGSYLLPLPLALKGGG